MRPLKLKMEAFGSYGRETVIDFTRPSQELFLITGDTGSGKSTIFEAIVYVLYGAAKEGIRDKKSGLDYRSQFVRDGVVPYAELTFTELTGGEELTYTVRRSPKHNIRKKRGEGFKEVSESLSLIMPDGSEYQQKEAQEKITGIVGLTRDQFMQVAMIAQGEFRELISSDTDKRRNIFRKLFGTEIYKRIVDELAVRRKQLENEMDTIKSVFASEAARIELPENIDEDSILPQTVDNVKTAKKLDITEIETLTGELGKLCDHLSARSETAKKESEKAEKERDRVRAEYTRADALIESFEAAENAEKTLRECAAGEEGIKEAAKLRTLIQDSFAVMEKHTVYDRAKKDAEETAIKLKALREALPSLTETAAAASSEEEKTAEQYRSELEACTKVRERTAKAVRALKEFREAQKLLNEKSAELNRCAALMAAAEQQEKEWKERLTALSGADVRLLECGHRREKLNSAGELFKAAAEAQKEAEKQERKAEAAKAAYLSARQAHDAANEEYIIIRSRFLDAQAGLLARDLVEGEKCPVCGSKSHPEPCVLKDEHRELTREMVDKKSAEVQELDKAQNERSAESNSAAEILEVKQAQAADRLSALLEAAAELSGRDTADMTAAEAGAELDALKKAADREYTEAEENARLLAEVQEKLDNAADKGQELRERAREASENVNAARNACAAAEAAVSERSSHIDFTSEEEAGKALSEAEAALTAKERQRDEAHRKAEDARSQRDSTATRIKQYQEQLPIQENRREELRAEYEQEMKAKDIAEHEWKDITSKHSAEEIKSLTERIDTHNRMKVSAEAALEAAKKAVGEQEKPDMAVLKEARDRAEAVYAEAAGRAERIKELLRTDRGVLESLKNKTEERRQVAETYTRTESLYNRLAGKVSGGKMDVETRVQRFYLARILDAANRRFAEMSDGKFELRMTSEEAAAKGVNTGLDLMVYSNVNGSEREIKTLSGGESFMAALALALGMADQIQESSAAVNLDIMFIDEGFGSLSDHARAQAIKVLRNMAGGSRLIGIISHVTELKQQIDDKLVVEKDETGSSVRWVIS